MKTINLTDMELTTPYLDFELAGENVDLENYYELKKVIFTPNELIFILRLRPEYINYLVNHVKIIFSEPQIISNRFSIYDTKQANTIINLQRIRGIINDQLSEHDDEGRNFYLIEFIEGQSIELVASRLIIEMNVETENKFEI